MALAGGYTTNTPLTPVGGGGYRLRPRDGATTSPVSPTGDDLGRKQADQLANPTQVDIKTAPNPFQTTAFGDVKGFADSLADRSNASIINAMQRTRDVGANAISDAVAQAGRRGGAPGSGLSGVVAGRAAAENQRQVAKTNADLTDVALNRETQARAIEMGGATDIARDQSDMFGKQADLYLGTRKADLDRADYYSRERDSRWKRATDIADMADDEGMDPSTPGYAAPTMIGGLGRTANGVGASPVRGGGSPVRGGMGSSAVKGGSTGFTPIGGGYGSRAGFGRSGGSSAMGREDVYPSGVYGSPYTAAF